MVQDSTGQCIFPYDLVKFETTAGGGRHGDRGLALRGLHGNKVISVLRVDGTEVEKAACDLTVVDRSFLCIGMAVASVSDQSGQPGVITDVTTALDLVHLVDGEPTVVVATGVSPAEVRPVKELTVGDYVVSGAWLGRVVELSVNVNVVFGDGSVCRVTEAGDKLRRLVGKSFWGKRMISFFPGDAVATAGDASVFKASRWLRGHWKRSHGEGTVAKVEMGGVLVYWVASLHGEASASAPPPASYQPNPRNLTFFCSGGGSDPMWYWCVSARCFFRSPNSAPARAPKKQHRRCNRILTIRMGLKRARRPVAGGRRFAEVKWPMAVADTRTMVDVLWQDGTRQRGVPSASLVRIGRHKEQDFFPGQRVIGKVLSPPPVATGGSGANAAAGRSVGIVRSLSCKDQTVRVSWITAATPGDQAVVDTVMSRYDLTPSPDHGFFYGDMVVRLPSRASSSAVGGGTEETVPPVRRSNKATTNDLSWVGIVVDLCDAQHFHVKWGNGTTSKVLLHEIAFVQTRTVDGILHEMGDWVPDGDEDEDDSGSGSDAEHSPVGGTAIICKVGNVIVAVIQTLSRIFAQGKMYMLSRSVAMASASRAEPAAMTENIQTCSTRIGDGRSYRTEGESAAPAALASHDAAGDDVFHFKHFDVVQSPHDHHYLDNREQGSGGGSKWLKRVQKEWEILETSLPDTIYVRAFEDRMDLLRAVMVGASGTPYQDGLFLFDLQLPPSYPAMPPLVKYHSFGLKVNPNLYPSGTVCLSLLNTFGGKGTERWSPEASSILQVVVSIQGLVLTAQPYYNEAGYAVQAGTTEGRRNEILCCENTYLVNLHTMLQVIRRPPKGFEAFVRDHFHRRGRRVLRACEAYMQKACPVGTLDDEAFATTAGRGWSCSMGFRLALANLFPRLVEAFAGSGTQGCDEFHEIRVPPLHTAISGS